jgi:hypothetical protein
MADGGESKASLLALANKCRTLALQVTDDRAAASLRKLAEEYEAAANAADQQHPFLMAARFHSSADEYRIHGPSRQLKFDAAPTGRPAKALHCGPHASLRKA